MKIIRWKMWSVGVLCLLCLLPLFAQRAEGRQAIDVQKTASLQIQYQVKQQAMPQISFRLYHVAEVSAALRFTRTEAFAGYPVSLDGLDSEGWNQLAQTLAGYAEADTLTPIQEKKTDNQGTVTFSDLSLGLYLVVGDKCTVNGTTYVPAPFLVCLPNETAQGQWDYHPTAIPKYSSNTPSNPGGNDPVPPSDTVDRSFIKVWSDKGAAENRPDAIEVQLLRDGKVYDTVMVTKASQWRHTWANLSADAVWRIVERNVPSGYTVTVVQEGSTFVMTNTAESTTPVEPVKPEEEPKDEPEIPTIPGSDNDTTDPEHEIEDGDVPTHGLDFPENPSDPSNSSSDGSSSGQDDGTEKLPQTGQLWWPEPILAAVGLCFFLIGWVLEQKRR